MSNKALVILTISACLLKTIFCQCLNAPYNAAIVGPGLVADGIYGVNDLSYGGRFANDLAYNLGARGVGYDAYGLGPVGGIVPASGGRFPVTCSSPIAPAGLSVLSENAIEGILAVSGELPVLSAVALEGALPTIGSGTIAYGCGDGSIGIVSELAPKLPYAPQAADLPYSAGLPYRGLAPYAPATCGCGAY